MPLPPAPVRRAPTQGDKDLLFKGVTCALIGVVVLLAPFIARAPDVRQLMAQGAVAGWFALVLGLALLARYGWRRHRAGKGQ